MKCEHPFGISRYKSQVDITVFFEYTFYQKWEKGNMFLHCKVTFVRSIKYVLMKCVTTIPLRYSQLLLQKFGRFDFGSLHHL